MSPRTLASAFMCAAGTLILAGAGTLLIWSSDYALSVGTGLLFIAATAAGTGVGIRLQESYRDDQARYDAAQEQLYVATPADPGAAYRYPAPRPHPGWVMNSDGYWVNPDWTSKLDDIRMTKAEVRRVVGKPWPEPGSSQWWEAWDAAHTDPPGDLQG